MISFTYRYNRVINWFKNHKLPNDIRCEIHHIVPKSLGGTNKKSNLVRLPLRWHYIVHCWLPLVYSERGNYRGYEKMLFAWKRLENSNKPYNNNTLTSIKRNSLLYENIRTKYLEAISKHMKKARKIKNGMKNMQWYVNYDSKTNIILQKGDLIPPGFVPGRCINFEKILDKIEKKKLKEEKETAYKQKMIETWTEITKDYNEHGFNYIQTKYDLTISKTSVLNNMRSFSSIPPNIKHMDGIRRNLVGKQSDLTLRLRKLSKKAKQEFYTEIYNDYVKNGFDYIKKHYNYPNTKNCLLMSFKTYVPEYTPVKCNRWKNQ